MYKVNLQLQVWDSDSVERSEKWVVVYKQIDIPFIPFTGLEIGFPMERGQTVKSVRWNVENNSFSCYLEDEFCLMGIDDPMFDEWIEYYESNGWSLDGPHQKTNE